MIRFTLLFIFLMLRLCNFMVSRESARQYSVTMCVFAPRAAELQAIQRLAIRHAAVFFILKRPTANHRTFEDPTTPDTFHPWD
jgi:hypothetical protein